MSKRLVTIDDDGVITKKRNTIKFPRAVEPDGSDYEKNQWRLEQLNKCRYGDEYMCGRYYFFYHFCVMETLKKEVDEVTGEVTPAGKTRPEFRVSQLAWFEFLDWCERKNRGAICVKRRRAGFSWLAAADALYDAMFNKNAHIGMNSKSEVDSRLLFKKVKFIYSNLPGWMRPTTQAGSSRDYMFFGRKIKDEFGNDILSGLCSDITCVAPTVSAWEGRMLNKWISDEAGKTENIVQMFSFTEDCLSDGGTVRAGVPIIFGTSGEVDKVGAGLKELWYAAESYQLQQFFYSGIMGLIVDQYGNDDEEAALRYIQDQRKKNEKKRLKDQQDFIQKYPLTPEEAFLTSSNVGIGDPLLRERRLNELKSNPVARTQGAFVKRNGSPEFIPNATGMFTMFQYPDHSLTNANVAGCDPVDHKGTAKDASSIAAVFMAKAHGLKPAVILGRYCGKPNDPVDAYEQIAMACMFFKCQVLVERNRPGIINYFEQNGYRHLLKMEPIDKTRIYASAPNRFGVHMSEDKKHNHMAPLMTDYIDKNIDYVPDEQLLKECGDWCLKNTDILMAFGLALLYLEDEYKAVPSSGVSKAKLFKTKMIKINGVPTRVAA